MIILIRWLHAGKDSARSLQRPTDMAHSTHATAHRPRLFPRLQNRDVRHLSLSRTSAHYCRGQCVFGNSTQRCATSPSSPAVKRSSACARQPSQHDHDVDRLPVN